ncbi:494_t:CDS:2, partial [Paraglomus brasilianum]
MLGIDNTPDSIPSLQGEDSADILHVVSVESVLSFVIVALAEVNFYSDFTGACPCSAAIKFALPQDYSALVLKITDRIVVSGRQKIVP